jgi:hypothetical protein
MVCSWPRLPFSQHGLLLLLLPVLLLPLLLCLR